MLSLCLAAGAAFFGVQPYGASEFAGGTPFSSTGRSEYYHNGRYSGSIIADGVDISAWQSSDCNLATAKSAGVDFAILRVTWTASKSDFTYKNNDSSFASNYKSAKNAGVLTGVYVFSQARTKSEASKEAAYAIKRLKALGIGPEDLELPLYMDYEFTGGNSGRLTSLCNSLGAKKFRSRATACANAFCDTVREAGYTPGIYANTVFFSKYLNTSKIPSDVDLWCAQYYKRCESGVDYSKWQYSSTARIGGLLSYLGVKGNIDVNFWYLDKEKKLSPEVKVSGKTKLAYSGKSLVPKLTLKNGSAKLKEGSDYVIGGIDNIEPGPAYAYIRGRGKYSGYQIVPFTIRPPETTVKTLEPREQGFWIKVAKKKKGLVTGYQVRYSRKENMKDSETKTIGSKYSKVSNTISVNARDMKYYVQVRTYRKVDGKKYYSAWSTKYTVTSN